MEETHWISVLGIAIMVIGIFSLSFTDRKFSENRGWVLVLPILIIAVLIIGFSIVFHERQFSWNKNLFAPLLVSLPIFYWEKIKNPLVIIISIFGFFVGAWIIF